MLRFVLSTAAAVLLACTAVAGAQPRAAALSLEDTEGRTHSLAELHGRIVVVNFWATWCVPCLEEMPMLGRLHREYASAGVEFVGASADEDVTRPRIAPLLADADVDFPIWVGGNTSDMERLGLGSVIPATAIVDRDGRIAFRLLGQVTEEQMRERLDWLLSGRAARAPVPTVDSFALRADARPDRHDEHEYDDRVHDEHGDDAHVDADDRGHDEHGQDAHADADDDGHDHHGHDHGEEEEHQHGTIALEGASLVPS